MPPLPRPYVSAMPRGLLQNGFAIGQALLAGPSDAAGAPDPVLVRYRIGTGQMDTSLRLSVRNSERSHSNGSSGARVVQPLSDDPLWSIAPDGSGFVIVYREAATTASHARFRVVWYNDDGQQTGVAGAV